MIARRIPGDATAFVVIAVAMIATHAPLMTHGMCFNDPSWMFHFGHRTLHGEVPYRNYLFQVGPMPIYVDAAFQKLFGARYVASLYAALTIEIARVFVIWLIARRLASRRSAIALVVFCALDPIFSFGHHWSTAYAELLFTLSGLLLWLASRSDGRRALWLLALAGFSAGLIMASRQSTAVMIAVVAVPATAILLARKVYFTPIRFAALWAGFAAALFVLGGFLASQGALGDAFQQMFLDAAQKKGLHGLDAIFDPISGGAMANGSYTRLEGFLKWIAVPSAIVAASIYLGDRGRAVTSPALAFILLCLGVLLALLTRYASLDLLVDLPRTYLTVITGLAVVSPDRLRRWFGLEPLVAIGFAGFALASDWALELSFPGRGWGDPWGLATGVILVTLASSQLVEAVKLRLCIALAIAALVHIAVCAQVGRNPFAKDEASDGTIAENQFNPAVRGHHLPVLRGMRIPEWRAKAIEWLTYEIQSGATCFVYANAPALYDLLGCKNPTRLDDTITDYFTADDAAAAVATLRAHPPDYILAHDRTWLSPPLSVDLGSDIDRYESWNREASMAMHVGLRSIIDQYESLGTIGNMLGHERAQIAAKQWDAIDAIHVYRRRADTR